MRTTQGVGAGSTGGDFRFQGQWLENATGLYNFRARDYDSRTGTFLSRDPVDSTAQDPEALNPYQFVYNNPYVYSDPSGMITISELAAGQYMQNQLATVRTYVNIEAKRYLQQRAQALVTDALWSAMSSFLPLDNSVSKLTEQILRIADSKGQGIKFESLLRKEVCKFFRPLPDSFVNKLWMGAVVGVNTGDALSPGIHCPKRDAEFDLPSPRVIGTPTGERTARPDFIIAPEAPRGPGRRDNPASWLVGDIKLSLYRLAKDYTDIDGSPDKPNQFQAIANHAHFRRHGTGFTGFIALQSGNAKAEQRYKHALAAESLEKGVVTFVATIL